MDVGATDAVLDLIVAVLELVLIAAGVTAAILDLVTRPRPVNSPSSSELSELSESEKWDTRPGKSGGSGKTGRSVVGAMVLDLDLVTEPAFVTVADGATEAVLDLVMVAADATAAIIDLVTRPPSDLTVLSSSSSELSEKERVFIQ